MERTVKCPCCKKEALEMQIDSGYDIDFDKPFKEHTHRTICNNCLRQIKYSLKRIIE